MTTRFLALYKGASISEARLIAVSSEPEIVSRFVRELSGEPEPALDEMCTSTQREPLRLVGRDEE